MTKQKCLGRRICDRRHRTALNVAQLPANRTGSISVTRKLGAVVTLQLIPSLTFDFSNFSSIASLFSFLDLS